jgi:hypothetical protein
LKLNFLRNKQIKKIKKTEPIPAPAQPPKSSSRLLPSINENTKSNSNPKLNTLINKINKSKIRTSRRSKHFQSYNIDKYVLNKSLEIIDLPWSLNQYTKSKKIINSNTENLIFKLKKLFRRQYEIKSSSNLNRIKSSYNNNKNNNSSVISTINNDIYFSRQNSSIRSISNESTRTQNITNNNNIKTNIDLKSIYLKKLKNNYYDRKLWNTLVQPNTNQLSIYTEKSIRDYNSEFNILKHNDWTMSSFAACISFIYYLLRVLNK